MTGPLALTMAMAAIAEFGSVKDAARLFDVGEHAIRSGVADGTIPSVRIGRFIRIPLRMIVGRLEAETSEAPDVEIEGFENDSQATGVRHA